MRYSSVLSTVVVPRRLRRRLAFLVCAKWRLPALERRTFPLAVILNRLATDFFVLMPLGRRINQFSSIQKERAIYVSAGECASDYFSHFERSLFNRSV